MNVADNETYNSRAFYKEILELLDESGVEYMLGGAFAVFHYTGLFRDTKDLDIFVRPRDYAAVLKFFADKGYAVQLYDVRWIAKIFKGDYFVDVIFNSVNNICRVDDVWFERAAEGLFCERRVKFLPAVELIWCKATFGTGNGLTGQT